MVETYTNSASRIHNILNRARQQGDGIQIADIWSEALGMKKEDLESFSFLLIEALALIKNEINSVEAQMDASGFSSTLYKPYLDRCRRAISVTNLTSAWGNYKSNLGEDTLLCLQFCSEIIPKDEILIENEELEEILQIINNLLVKVENSDISPTLKDLIKQHISIIHKAIHKYPISGAESLKEGLRTAMNKVVEEEATIRANADKEEVSLMIRILGKVRKVGNGIIEADKVTNALIKLLDKAEDGINLLEHMQ